MTKSTLFGLLCTLLVVGCGERAPQPTTTAAQRGPEAPQTARTLPPQFEAVGGPCGQAGLCSVCAGDRVAAVAQPADFLQLPDEEAVISRREPAAPASGQRELSWTIALSDGILSAQILTCARCRRQLGWSLVVALDELELAEPETRRRVQAALGWPAEPLLGGEADWRGAEHGAPTESPPCVVGDESAALEGRAGERIRHPGGEGLRPRSS